jgi:plasmid stabilization system protein ParE
VQRFKLLKRVMLPVVWLDDALQDLDQIVGFIAERNPHAAYALAAQLTEDADTLGSYPPTIVVVGCLEPMSL